MTPHPSETLHGACARVETANGGCGTAYLVHPQWAVTCAHVVQPPGKGGEVNLFFLPPSDNVEKRGPVRRIEALVRDLDDQTDCAVLQLLEPYIDVEPLTLAHGQAGADARWESYGYPRYVGDNGIPLKGTVELSQGYNREGKPAVVLYCASVAAGPGAIVSGASGAPVLVGKRVVGHIMNISLLWDGRDTELDELARQLQQRSTDQITRERIDRAIASLRERLVPTRAEWGLLFACPVRFVRRLLERQQDFPVSLKTLSVSRDDLVIHWGPRSRGVEIEAQPGWYFTGRTAALAEIVQWLNAPNHDNRPRAIIGHPGSGKSAILARLVTLSAPEYRRSVPFDAAPPETVPPEGVIDLALNAKNRSLEECVAQIAETTGIDASQPELLVDGLARQERRWVIVLDSLDEAVAPYELARKLLRPLGMVPTVRLLVGTRREFLQALGSATVAIDLDDTRYINRADIAEYVKRRLLAEHEPTRTTPYRGQEVLAGKVAEAVGERAYPVFLISQLISQALIESPEPVNPDQPGWREQFPTTVGDAFDAYLDRFDSDRQRVRDLLRPLAYAEGAGLPWENLWADLATAIAGVPRGDSDVEWLLDRAGSFIVESDEEDRPVYRLYHQSLADHLHIKNRDAEIHRRIADTLIAHTSATNEGKKWLRALPYVRHHLAAHAAKAGMLGELLSDPLFLVAAEPSPLLHSIVAYSRELPRDLVHVYQSVSHLLRTSSLADRSSYLEMGARQSGLDALADQFSGLPLPRPFSVPWANWESAATHRVIHAHTRGQITSIAVGKVDGRAVIISADSSGNSGYYDSLRIWDLATGKRVGGPLQGHEGPIASVATGELNGRPVMVTGGRDDRTIRIWDLASGQLIGQPMKGHDYGRVNSVVLGVIDGHAVIVSGGSDGTVRVWDPTTGLPMGKPLRHGDIIASVAIGKFDSRVVIVSGSWDGTVQVWDLATGQSLGEPLRGHDRVFAVAVGELSGRGIVISGGNDDGVVKVWDLATRRPASEPVKAHVGGVHALALGELNGRAVIVSAGCDESLRIWDLATGEPVGEPLRGHDGFVSTVSVDSIDGRATIVSGGTDGTIRVWDLAPHQPVATGSGSNNAVVHSVAVAELDGREIVVSEDGGETVRAWCLTTGKPLGFSVRCHDDRGRYLTGHLQVAAGKLHNRSVVVAESGWGKVWVWDLATREPVDVPGLASMTEGDHGSVAAGGLEGHALIYSHSQSAAEPEQQRRSFEPIDWNKTIQTLRIRELATGKPIGAPISFHGLFASMTVGQLAGRSVVAIGSEHGDIWVQDLATNEPLGTPLVGHEGVVSSVAVGDLDGHAVLVSSGKHDRTVRVWGVAGELRMIIAVDAEIHCVALASDARLVVATAKGMMAIRLNPAVCFPSVPRTSDRRSGPDQPTESAQPNDLSLEKTRADARLPALNQTFWDLVKGLLHISPSKKQL